ncbi:cytochrome c oxidase assembly factor 8 [Bacillus rossius redtenbacheri]|uniref:cytochrome c oxidase assembly factor 8 n=1 Tax=Bacillus rossius redtenbacheri TaxID=93214 RepID=UPI002FDD046C
MRKAGLISAFTRRFSREGSSNTSHVKVGQWDMIGPPNPVSNLRPVIFRIKPNESKVEEEFRLRRGEVQEWNERFWHGHNTSFFKEREAYIASHLPSDSPGKEKRTLSAKEMSVFYKQFLDKNWKVHLEYNIEWYRKNIGLVFLALKVKVHHWLHKVHSSTPRTR